MHFFELAIELNILRENNYRLYDALRGLQNIVEYLLHEAFLVEHRLNTRHQVGLLAENIALVEPLAFLAQVPVL